jgi:hypothetical protein
MLSPRTAHASIADGPLPHLPQTCVVLVREAGRTELVDSIYGERQARPLLVVGIRTDR